MRKILATLVLVVAFLAPPQIVLAQEEPSEFFEIMGRVHMVEMKLQKVKEMMMHPKKKMSRGDMKKMKEMLATIEREIDKLLGFGRPE